MMRLILFFILLLATVWIGVSIAHDPGYLLLVHGKLAIEMPLWFAGVMLIVIVALTSFLLRLVYHSRHLRRRLRRWRECHRKQRAVDLSQQGILAMGAGYWQQAEKWLSKSAKNMEHPAVNYLACAFCMQELKQIGKRDEYLQLARSASNATQHVMLSIIEAKIYLANNQREQAIARLQQCLHNKPRRSQVLSLLAEQYIALKDWQHLHQLIPNMRLANTMPPKELQALEIQALKGLMNTQSEKGEDIRQFFATLSRQLRQEPTLIACYVKHLLAQEQHHEASDVLKRYLNRHWNETLIELLGLTHGPDPGADLKLAESWLKKHPTNPTLLLCLGRLAIINQLWGKARNYLENSLHYAQKPETYVELAQLLEQLGEHERAVAYYRDAAHVIRSS